MFAISGRYIRAVHRSTPNHEVGARLDSESSRARIVCATAGCPTKDLATNYTALHYLALLNFSELQTVSAYPGLKSQRSPSGTIYIVYQPFLLLRCYLTGHTGEGWGDFDFRTRHLVPRRTSVGGEIVVSSRFKYESIQCGLIQKSKTNQVNEIPPNQ